MTPQENFINTTKDKKVLFIENDTGLYNGLELLEEQIILNNIQYVCLFDATNVSLDTIIQHIENNDVIIFQTTWTYEVSKEIYNYLYESKNKKIIIENYINEPSWYYKPDVIHDVYILNNHNTDEDWSFYKLSDKAYWDYENKFDK